MKKLIAFLIIIAFTNPLLGFASEDKALSKIVDEFGAAIKTKDKARFLDLFVDSEVSWVGVFSEKEFEKVRGQEGGPGKLFFSSPTDFIDWVVALDSVPSETFKDVVIKTDGEVASIYFDYQFYIDDKVQNWGAESWLLVKSESGWKIHAVNFSYSSGK